MNDKKEQTIYEWDGYDNMKMPAFDFIKILCDKYNALNDEEKTTAVVEIDVEREYDNIDVTFRLHHLRDKTEYELNVESFRNEQHKRRVEAQEIAAYMRLRAKFEGDGE